MKESIKNGEIYIYISHLLTYFKNLFWINFVLKQYLWNKALLHVLQTASPNGLTSYILKILFLELNSVTQVYNTKLQTICFSSAFSIAGSNPRHCTAFVTSPALLWRLPLCIWHHVATWTWFHLVLTQMHTCMHTHTHILHSWNTVWGHIHEILCFNWYVSLECFFFMYFSWLTLSLFSNIWSNLNFSLTLPGDLLNI